MGKHILSTVNTNLKEHSVVSLYGELFICDHVLVFLSWTKEQVVDVGLVKKLNSRSKTNEKELIQI